MAQIVVGNQTMNFNAYEQVAENRYRENKGFYYEDFVVGTVIEHTPGRTITMTDNIWQSLISMNQHPVHIDAEYAKTCEFGKILVSSLVTFNIINGLTVHSISHRAIANLGWDQVKLNHPVFVGDTLCAETEIISKRLSKSRTGQGIVIVKTTGKNQHNKTVIQFLRSILIPSQSLK